LVKLTVKAIKVGNSIRVAIPAEILKSAHVSEGDTLLMDYDGKSDRIVIEKENGAR